MYVFLVFSVGSCIVTPYSVLFLTIETLRVRSKTVEYQIWSYNWKSSSDSVLKFPRPFTFQSRIRDGSGPDKRKEKPVEQVVQRHHPIHPTRNTFSVMISVYREFTFLTLYLGPEDWGQGIGFIYDFHNLSIRKRSVHPFKPKLSY